MLSLTGVLTGATGARPVPRPDGHRARARDHDQVAGGAPAVHRPRRRRLHPQPDRHPGPRRLHLRGVPVPGGMRGGGPPGGCGPGDRGPDAGQPLPRTRERPDGHPGAQQDRPACGAARQVRRGVGAHHRMRPGRGRAGVREDRRRRRRPARAGGRGRPRADGDHRRTGQGVDLRLRLRLLPRSGHVCPCRRWAAAASRPDRDDVDRRGA